MADTAVALSALTAATLSGDLVAGGTSVSSGNVAVIAAGAPTGKLLLCFYFASTGTVTVEAGVNPPSQLAGLGATAALSVTGGMVKCLVIQGAEYTQTNGTIRVDIGSNTAVVTALRIPNTV